MYYQVCVEGNSVISLGGLHTHVALGEKSISDLVRGD